MTGANALPCEHCQTALHEHEELEYLYCGHANVVAFRFRDGQVDFIAVKSMDEAIAIIHESGQAAVPLSIPA
ncbi:MAG: hypothetical protein WBO34_08360 [Gammaproteobacteria bacterium]